MNPIRYVTGSVSGYSEAIHTGPAKFKTIWYVQDAWNCYRTVKRFRGPKAEANAARFAADLNADRVPTRGSKTHCKRGHEMTEANTYLKKNGFRECHICRSARRRAAA